MTGPHAKSVTELDLMAYADGLLDPYPARKAEVEAYLNRHPDVARRIRDYAEQNEEIRAAYGGVLEQPVPARFYRILERRRGSGTTTAARAAMAAVLLVATGFGGWLAGTIGAPDGRSIQTAFDDAIANYLGAPSGMRPGITTAQAGPERPLDWLADELSVRLQIPDLSPHGFVLADKRLVSGNGHRVVRLDYDGHDGARLTLFVAPRWSEGAAEIEFAERDGVTLAYWANGPLVYALASDIDRPRMATLTSTIHDSMRSAKAVRLSPKPSPMPEGPAEMADAPVGNAAVLGPPAGDTRPLGEPQPFELQPN